MSLPAILSLIFATLLGLLPIFLLVGRRAIASRMSRRRDNGQNESPPDTPEMDQPTPRLAVSGTGDPAGESEILDRLIRERRAAAQPRREAGRTRLGSGQFDSLRIEGAAAASASEATARSGSRIEARLGRLNVLQRAIVYREILGPPVGLRAPGDHERY